MIRVGVFADVVKARRGRAPTQDLENIAAHDDGLRSASVGSLHRDSRLK